MDSFFGGELAGKIRDDVLLLTRSSRYFFVETYNLNI
jgi:hypothetical protein